MRFKISFSDQIVGFFIIFSLAALVFVFVMLGRSQRWFSKDVSFYTILPSADGLSNNMAVQYRGFTIGNVKTFYLNADDDVEVVFFIYEEYYDRVRQGSMVESISSPIGLGSSFMFHSGNGSAVLREGSFIPVAGSPQARELIRQGLAVEPRHDDSITMLLTRANTTLEEVNQILAHVNEALGPGSEITEIGRIVGSLQRTMEDAEGIPQNLDSLLTDISGLITEAQRELIPILANVGAITDELSDPDIYVSLAAALGSVTSILDSLDTAIAFIPSQLPQIAGIIMELRQTLAAAEDVLVALSNNPILRGGIPQRPETQGGGTSPRDLRF